MRSGVDSPPDVASNLRPDPVYVLRVIGHPVRIRILELLTECGEMNVDELQAA